MSEATGGQGEAEVTVTWGEYSDTAEVVVSAEEIPLPEGVNTITILREFPDGSIKKFGGSFRFPFFCLVLFPTSN